MSKKKPSHKVGTKAEALKELTEKVRAVLEHDFKSIADTDSAGRDRFLKTMQPIIADLIKEIVPSEAFRVTTNVYPDDPSRVRITIEKPRRFIVRYDKSYSLAVDAYTAEEAIKKAETEAVPDDWETSTGEMEAELENGEE